MSRVGGSSNRGRKRGKGGARDRGCLRSMSRARSRGWSRGRRRGMRKSSGWDGKVVAMTTALPMAILNTTKVVGQSRQL